MSYTVSEMNGCKLIKGSVPAAELAALLRTWGESWLFDGELGLAVGVSVVVGPPEKVRQWRLSLGLPGTGA